MMKITPGHLKHRYRPDVQVMALSIAKSIIAKFTVVNFQGRVSVAAGQNTVLVIKKSAILDLQVSFFEPDSSTIIDLEPPPQ